ncbi:hypothetical protein PMG11_11139 [Penicillium brasilianum]|uniref:Uncharacterized protein n=1 Tax=Penicillium brasilianum TaxID=104259 RepID=A0A0F7U114_PENBI|nr:hypothetical protein PMG11_11139 [Penicillium brasilianum]
MIITSAKTEITHYKDEIETRATVVAAKTVLEGFGHDFMPYVNTIALTEKTIENLDSLRSEARGAIVKLHELIPVRAKSGDGAALQILYRNLLAVVQCTLTMDRLQYGPTHAVVMEAKSEINHLLFLIGVINEGLWLVSDHCSSPGIVRFHIGGKHGSPELTNDSYHYKGKRQPVSGSNMALVSQAFIEARKAARDHAIPQEVFDWENLLIGMTLKFQELEKTVPA